MSNDIPAESSKVCGSSRFLCDSKGRRGDLYYKLSVRPTSMAS